MCLFYVEIVLCSTLLTFFFFAGDTFSIPHFSSFDNFRIYEKVDDGGFGGFTAPFSGSLSPPGK
jgi:hypothetical protein